MPLIGGQAIGQANALGSRPAWLASYAPFAKNDEHLAKYWSTTPWVLSDAPLPRADVVGATCPCAGLSGLSTTSSASSKHNDWMYIVTERVLSEARPLCYWGENAPALFTKKGAPVLERLADIASKHGYSVLAYRTASALHGAPQTRERCFYMMFRGEQVPVLRWIRRERRTIEEILDSVPHHETDLVPTGKSPWTDPWYAYARKMIFTGMTHAEACASLDATTDCMRLPQQLDEWRGWGPMGTWFKEVMGDHKTAARCFEANIKGQMGLGIMQRVTTLPRRYIGAFVSHLPWLMTHHREERYLTWRECMAIMGMPPDMIMIDPRRRLNHVCQNVPVRTATDLALEIRAALSGEREWVRGAGRITRMCNAKRSAVLD